MPIIRIGRGDYHCDGLMNMLDEDFADIVRETSDVVGEVTPDGIRIVLEPLEIQPLWL